MCPLAKAEKRLSDCLEFWKQAEASYQEPVAFVRNTQATIHGLRSVTFLLQSAKRQIPGFEAWYADWQEKMRQDRVLRWLVEIRNNIEKVGDIEPASKLRLTFCRGWLDDEEGEMDFQPTYTARKAADLFATLVGPSSSAEEALIRFQREWRHPELPDSELLDALTYCYSFLQELLLDGHRCLPKSAAEECAFHRELLHTNSRMPVDMQGRHSGGSAWYRLIDQSIVSFNLNPTILGAKESDIASRRYGEYGDLLKSDAKDLLAKCNNLMIAGQRVLKADGYLIPAFFIEGEGLWLPVMYQPRDRADKHAIVREVADAVLLHRADLVRCIAEAWIATADPKKPSVHAVDYPDRREGILAACLSRTGETTSLRCKFTRTHSGIEFGEIENIGTVVANFLEPIRRALRKI